VPGVPTITVTKVPTTSRVTSLAWHDRGINMVLSSETSHQLLLLLLLLN
jgi:hypothetical protein